MSHSIGPPDGKAGQAGGGGVPRHRGSCASGCRCWGESGHNGPCVREMKQGAATGAQRGTSEHRQAKPFLHAINAERSEFQSAGSRSLPVCMKHDTRSVRVGEHPRGLSPAASGCGTERSVAAGQRSCSLVAAQRSGVQRTEMPESGCSAAAVCVCWRTVPSEGPDAQERAS